MAVSKYSFCGVANNCLGELLSIQTRFVDYGDGEAAFEGVLAWDDAVGGPRPGVLVAPTIRGRSAFEIGKAKALAELGYVGFALDVFGKTEIGADAETARQHMEMLLADRTLLQQRLNASLSAFLKQPEVDIDMVAAIGFCFGGLCVLDLARMGAPLRAVASFHGLFTAPGNTAGNKIEASVLALHGWDDPMAQPQSVVALGEELSAAGADWQIHGYGGARHSFTNPEANDHERGTVYHSLADQRSWLAMQNFLEEQFD